MDGLVRVVSIAAVGIVGSVTVVSPTGIVDSSVEVMSPVVVVGWPTAALTGNIREAHEYNKRNTICNFILVFFLYCLRTLYSGGHFRNSKNCSTR